MNDFFYQKVEILKKTSPDPKKAILFNKPFFFISTDFGTIMFHLTDLSNTSLIGDDGIQTQILKKFKKLLIWSILHIAMWADCLIMISQGA